jgi:4-hydroxybenzoate polyprenyltransferase
MLCWSMSVKDLSQSTVSLYYQSFLKNLIISVRPKQWYKNILLFIAIIFSHNLLNYSIWTDVMLSFLYFCAISAAEYLINDIIDKNRDRVHPVKANRPIASGQLKISYALLIALALIMLSLLGAYFTINYYFFLTLLSYTILILLYSFKLKHLIIIDIIIISIGFVIRAIAGCVVIGVFISPWLIICTFLLALFLTLGKRSAELLTLGSESTSHRATLKGYSSILLNQLLNITTAALITAYLLYTFHTNNYYLLFTVPFAIYGLFRYLYLIQSANFGGQPEMIFKDKPLVIDLILWSISAILILYFTQIIVVIP